MASALYAKARLKLINGTFEGGTGLARTDLCMLLLKTVPGNLSTDEFVAAAVAGSREATATNYVRKTGITLTIGQSGDVVTMALGADVTWTAIGGTVDNTIVGAVLYKPGTSDANSPLIAYFDIENHVTDGTDFMLKREAAGNVTWATE